MWGLAPPRLDRRFVLMYGCLAAALVAQGFALTQSYAWLAPMIGLLVVALSTDIPIVPTVGLALLVRVLTSEAVSSPRAHYSTSLNISALIALLFIVLAVGLLLHRRQRVGLALAAALWLCFWTVIAVSTHGGQALTFRESVREASIVAVAVIVWNARGAFTVATAVRIVQIAGIGSALLAIYQFATHTGLNLEGDIRSNGTFTHPNGAAMYFAIAVTASLWRFLDHGRRPLDAIIAGVYAVATITTFCVGGLASLLTMLIIFGALRPGALRLKLGACAVGLMIVVAFAATPVGAKRLTNESSTSIQSAETRGTANTSLAWRFYKWRTLLPQWEQAPILGQGLGTTVTAEGNSQNTTAGKVPHNEYVRYLVETGAAGLASVLLAITMLVRRLGRVRRIRGTHNVGTLGMAIVAGCVVNGLGDNTLLYSTTGYAAALIVAAVFSAVHTRSKPSTHGSWA